MSYADIIYRWKNCSGKQKWEFRLECSGIEFVGLSRWGFTWCLWTGNLQMVGSSSDPRNQALWQFLGTLLAQAMPEIESFTAFQLLVRCSYFSQESVDLPHFQEKGSSYRLDGAVGYPNISWVSNAILGFWVTKQDNHPLKIRVCYGRELTNPQHADLYLLQALWNVRTGSVSCLAQVLCLIWCLYMNNLYHSRTHSVFDSSPALLPADNCPALRRRSRICRISQRRHPA